MYNAFPSVTFILDIPNSSLGSSPIIFPFFLFFVFRSKW